MNTYLQIIIGIGVAAVSVGVFYGQFWNGKNSVRKNEIDTENSLNTYLRNQIKTFEEVTKQQDEKINTLGRELAAMKASNDEKDRQINKYLEILQNRNPELDKILKEIKDFMHSINIHMEKYNNDLKIEAIESKKIK